MIVFVLVLTQTSLASQQNTQTCAIIGNTLPTFSCKKVRAFHIFFNFVFRKVCLFLTWALQISGGGLPVCALKHAHVLPY